MVCFWYANFAGKWGKTKVTNIRALVTLFDFQ